MRSSSVNVGGCCGQGRVAVKLMRCMAAASTWRAAEVAVSTAIAVITADPTIVRMYPVVYSPGLPLTPCGIVRSTKRRVSWTVRMKGLLRTSTERVSVGGAIQAMTALVVE